MKVQANTQIYNLSFVPQIAGFLLAEAVVLSKANPCRVARGRREAMVKVKNNKTI